MSSVPPPPPPSPPTPRSPPRKRARTSSHSNSPALTAAIIARAVDRAALSSIGRPAITIDASKDEGGGQTVRTALALSALLDLSVQLDNIRRHRPDPGLKAYHVLEAKTIALIAGALQAGARVGSRRVSMGVGIGYEGNFPVEARIETAGAASVVLQAVLPVVLRRMPRGEVLSINGATCTEKAPVSEYVRQVMVTNLRAFGIDLKYEVEKESFSSKAGGRVKVTLGSMDCEDGCLRSVNLIEKGQILSIAGKLIVYDRDLVKRGVVDAMVASAVKRLKKSVETRLNIIPVFPKSHVVIEDLSEDDTGVKCICFTLHAKTSCGVAFGSSVVWKTSEEESKPPGWSKGQHEKFKWLSYKKDAGLSGAEAARKFLEAVRERAAVDTNMADKLIIYMAMAKGTSTIRIPKLTSRVKSVIDVCRKFGVTIHLRAEYDDGYTIEVLGKGVKLVNT